MAFGFLRSFFDRVASRPVDWDELEEAFIQADLGLPFSLQLLEKLKARGAKVTADEARVAARQAILETLPRNLPPLRPLPNKPKAILLVGVNGTGKTTSAAKLAYWFKKNRHSVLLAAADTFRAAAIEQLVHWGDAIGVEVVRGQYNGDPAALCYDAYTSADRRNIEFLLCDTAGRLHTKDNLMQELAKVKRILAKHDPSAPQEKWLVVDATTGTNALVQAREFHQAVELTGIILTKLDGSGKGGVVVAIQHELGIPCRFVGRGEKLDDLAVFDPEAFVGEML